MARFVHQGMTSSDVLDTCLAVQLTRAADLLLADLDALLAALKRRAFEHKLTPRIGRSHGIHAEPVTMGLTFARFYAELPRATAAASKPPAPRSPSARSPAPSAPSPTSTPPSKPMSARRLGLTPEPISTQVIPRDRHAMFFATLGGHRRRRSRTSPPKSATCSAPRCWRRRNTSRPARRARRRCRTSATRCSARTSPASRAWSAPPSSRRWKTSRSGTSATSRHSSVERMIGAGRHHHARFRAGPPRPAWSTGWWSIPSGCRPTSTGSAGCTIRSACCWR